MNRMRNFKGLIFLILYPVHLFDFILYILSNSFQNVPVF